VVLVIILPIILLVNNALRGHTLLIMVLLPALNVDVVWKRQQTGLIVNSAQQERTVLIFHNVKFAQAIKSQM